MQGTPINITSNSSSYVVVKKLTQPITCSSSLNVSGYTTLLNNTTCMNNLNINGSLYCNSVNSAALNVSGVLTLGNSSALYLNNIVNTTSDSLLAIAQSVNQYSNSTTTGCDGSSPYYLLRIMQKDVSKDMVFGNLHMNAQNSYELIYIYLMMGRILA